MCRDEPTPRVGCTATSVRGHCRVAAQRGFTLLELMIVVVVVAILATVVLPSYQSYVLKARRADAKAALTTVAQLLERFATENASNGGYSKALLSDTPGQYVVARASTENNHYRVSFTVQSATAFTLAAAPQGAQASDLCKTFTLNHEGVRNLVDSTKTVLECWQ